LRRGRDLVPSLSGRYRQSVLDGAYSVGELNQEIAEVLRLTYANEIWVHGEIASLKRSRNGHVYFQLVDSSHVDTDHETGRVAGVGTRAPDAVMPVVLFDSAKRAVNTSLKQAGGSVRMTDGTRVRLRARIEFYAPQGRVQLRMTAIDPSFTLALLQTERDRVLTALAADKLLDRNASRTIPRVIERVGLVTSDGSAAMADFVHELESSGIGWQVVFAHAQVQGVDADQSIAAALLTIDRQESTSSRSSEAAGRKPT
jgi:exodeoxyribonuclease VII large subunit